MHYINKKIQKKAYNSQNIISSNISPNMHIHSFVCNNQNFLNSIGSKFPEKMESEYHGHSGNMLCPKYVQSFPKFDAAV